MMTGRAGKDLDDEVEASRVASGVDLAPRRTGMLGEAAASLGQAALQRKLASRLQRKRLAESLARQGEHSLQAKLEVGAPDDALEQEADRVADAAVDGRGVDPGGRRGPAAAQRALDDDAATDGASPEAEHEGGPGHDADAAHPGGAHEHDAAAADGSPEAAHHEGEDDGPEHEAADAAARGPAPVEAGAAPPVQAKALPGAEPGAGGGPANLDQQVAGMRGGGEALPGRLREQLEPRLGHDFSGVRVHQGEAARDASAALQARAFTVGSDVAFAAGQYQPGSREGQRLIAHELAHVVQQGAAPPVGAAAGGPAFGGAQRKVQRDFWGNVWGGIKKVGGDIGRGVSNAARAVGGAVKSTVSAIGGKAAEAGRWLGNKVGGVVSAVGAKAAAAGRWLGDKARAAASAVKSGVTGALQAVGAGVRAAGAWVGERLRDAGMWLVNLVRDLPERMVRLVVTLWDGLKGLGGFVPELLGQLVHHGLAGLGTWLGQKALAGLVWAGTATVHILDLLGLPEIGEFVLHLAASQRRLSGAEIGAAQSVLGAGAIRWGDIRVNSGGVLDVIFRLNHARAFTTWHTVNFPQGESIDVMVHELTHVFQYERAGSIYLAQALHAQATVGYGYGAGPGVKAAKARGGHYRDYNREQQAQMAQDYFKIISGRAPRPPQDEMDAYDFFIGELRAGQL